MPEPRVGTPRAHGERRAMTDMRLTGPVQVDRTGPDRIAAVTAIDTGMALLAGHYPGFPIYPGVALVECVRRALAAAVGGGLELEAVESTRFKSPVVPGDEITIDAAAVGDGRFRATVTSARGTAAELRVGVRPAAPLEPGVVDVLERLPHRYPMLLIDRITAIEPGRSLTAIKAVTCNEPWFAGSGDEDPCLPSVLLAESWCQAAGVLAVWDAPNTDVTEGSVMLLGSIADLRFEGRVQPGDVVEHSVRLVRALSDTVIVEGESRVGEQVVLEVGRVAMVLRGAEVLTGAMS